MLKKATLAASVSLAALLFAGGAQAAAYTWNFSGGSSANDGPDGNVRTFQSSPAGVSLNASAYEAPGTNTNLNKAYLGHYSPGLGVTNPGDTDHEVDNVGDYDVVVFEFLQIVDVSAITLVSFGDADISVWVGVKGAGNDFTGGERISNNFSGLTFIGSFDCDGTNPGNCDDDGDQVTYNINAGNVLGNYLVVTARVSGDGDDEEFKIKSLGADYNPPREVSEPGALAVFGLGLAALGYLGRRRKA